jgi:hypothetical protein
MEQSIAQAQQATEQAEAVAAAIVSQQRENNNESISSGSTTALGLSRTDSSSSGFTTTATDEDRAQSLSVAGFAAVDVLKSDTDVNWDSESGSRESNTVKQNAPDNDLAGGVTLAALGATPPGFQAYQIIMPDSQFYQPREIYPGQQTVDNRQALRGLGADRLFQDMINQQYRR